jgi:hypothetical protein
MIIDENNIDSLPENWPTPTKEESRSKIAATIEPGPARKKELETIKERRSAQAADEGTSIGDLMAMTAKVLESNTIYRTALASNVRAFHQAVEQEEEMDQLRREFSEMLERMKRMENTLMEIRDQHNVSHDVPSRKRDVAEG